MFPSLRQIRRSRKALLIAFSTALPMALFAQTPPMLTLQQAEAMAVKNHPQIQAAQNEVNFANQQIVINRAPYFPAINGEVTGSQGYDLARGSGLAIYRRRAYSSAKVKASTSSSWSRTSDVHPAWCRARASPRKRPRRIPLRRAIPCCWMSTAAISTYYVRRLR